MISKNEIKVLKALQFKKHRNSQDKFIIEGEKIVEEAVDSYPDLIDTVYSINENQAMQIKYKGIVSKHISKELLKKISSLVTPQPVIAVLKKPQADPVNFNCTNTIILGLDSVRDPGNMGTIIRLADWFGIHELICSKDCVDCYNPKVVQASMGAIFRVKIFYEDLASILPDAKENGYTIYGTTLDGNNLYKSGFPLKTFIIMGNESEGISNKIQQKIDEKIHIPNFSDKPDKTESLNVSTATSIILSEIGRQQNYSK